MIYEFINEHPEYSVTRWAYYYQVSRAGYYAYLRQMAQRKRERSDMKAKIKQIFDNSGGTYGADRICGILRRMGNKASYRKVSAYMVEMGLKSIHTRHRTRSLTDSRKARGAGYPNLTKGRVFTRPYQAVCSDITYLKSGEGWTYLCMVKDIVSGEILGTATDERMKKDLVMRAFLNAIGRHRLPKGMIYHTDRGCQYTSQACRDLLKQYGIKQSFSRVGMPGDNAWAESFFATLKKECLHFRQFQTRDELCQATFTWIESFYNTRRVQARLGYASPREYAQQYFARAA